MAGGCILQTDTITLLSILLEEDAHEYNYYEPELNVNIQYIPTIIRRHEDKIKIL